MSEGAGVTLSIAVAEGAGDEVGVDGAVGVAVAEGTAVAEGALRLAGATCSDRGAASRGDLALAHPPRATPIAAIIIVPSARES
ncbi:MAG: hypothetical protein FJZ90_17185 [Chloroflexi bacterium]|nr:hypothetical protein [Chloroflexota bacterium]